MSDVRRIFIYGSCVSRDTYKRLPQDQYSLTDYVARQSLVSAFSDPVTRFDPPVVGSRFTTAQVRGDFASSLPQRLATHAAGTDLILWDLTDERLGFYLLPDETVVTRTIDLARTEVESKVATEALLIPFGSEEHFALWCNALEAFKTRLAEICPQVPVLVLAPPWAAETSQHEPTAPSGELTAAAANEKFERYLDAIPYPVVRLDPASPAPLADAEHEWGPAPFHYVEDVYRELRDKIAAAT